MADEVKSEHEARVKALNEANAETAKVQEMPPTPTQEENDLLALHLMHPDDKGKANPPREHHPATATTRRDHQTASARTE